MPTYLLTQDVLNVSVSCTLNYYTHSNPKPINVLTWLRSSKYIDAVNLLRMETDKAKRDKLKALLPAITPSGTFTHVEAASLIEHSRLLQFDIDPKDNPKIRNYADLKAQISKLPFVAYCGLSASGNGFWGLVPIAYPERHSQHFDALRRVFAHYGIRIDTKPRSVASFRGYSYDLAPYLPERVMLFELYDAPPKPARPKPLKLTTDADKERTRVETCMGELTRRGLDLTSDYGDWYAIGCGLANSFGESGRDYYHHISQHHPKYQPGETDRQFTACLKAGSQATLGTFFHLCKQVGIEWKELMPYPARSEPPPGPAIQATDSNRVTSPATVTTIAQQLARPGSTLKPDESAIEPVRRSGLTVAPCDTYPAEWDTPNQPGAKPSISAKSFHEFQYQHSASQRIESALLQTTL